MGTAYTAVGRDASFVDSNPASTSILKFTEFSVSRVHSGVHSGFLHGAVKAANTVLDDTSTLRPPPPEGQRVALPPAVPVRRAEWQPTSWRGRMPSPWP